MRAAASKTTRSHLICHEVHQLSIKVLVCLELKLPIIPLCVNISCYLFHFCALRCKKIRPHLDWLSLKAFVELSRRNSSKDLGIYGADLFITKYAVRFKLDKRAFFALPILFCVYLFVFIYLFIIFICIFICSSFFFKLKYDLCIHAPIDRWSFRHLSEYQLQY